MTDPHLTGSVKSDPNLIKTGLKAHIVGTIKGKTGQRGRAPHGNFADIDAVRAFFSQRHAMFGLRMAL